MPHPCRAGRELEGGVGLEASAVTDLLSLTPPAARAVLGDWVAARGEPAYRVRQIVPRLWQRPLGSWEGATELPIALRRDLAAAFPLLRLTLGARQESRDGTEKFLWKLADGEAVESVLIPEGKRRTLCISSQVGCALGCVFCATGRMGFRRNLTAGEIGAQVRELVLLDPAKRPTNVVFMGMGEPLLNWPAVDTALTILNDADGLGIGARHITVSTVGILPNLEQLARRPEQFRLALSLHAPTPSLRHALMPIEKKYRLPDVIDALQRLRRRVTLEYVLIGGQNDALEHADELAEVARPLAALVNLLPLHPGGAPDLAPSPPAQMAAFARRLRSRGVEAVLRKSRGLDISAACGQLRVELEAPRRGGKVRPQEHAGVE
ncbi:MAG TPA: 23S rRNA (adenine(2503)-C(2))-methyltransferase RlmN [Gemmatimonadales bacterium]